MLPRLVDMVGDIEPLMPADDAAVMLTAAAEAVLVGGVQRRPVPPTVTSLTLALPLARLHPHIQQKMTSAREELCVYFVVLKVKSPDIYIGYRHLHGIGNPNSSGLQFEVAYVY